MSDDVTEEKNKTKSPYPRAMDPTSVAAQRDHLKVQVTSTLNNTFDLVWITESRNFQNITHRVKSLKHIYICMYNIDYSIYSYYSGLQWTSHLVLNNGSWRRSSSSSSSSHSLQLWHRGQDHNHQCLGVTCWLDLKKMGSWHGLNTYIYIYINYMLIGQISMF